MFEGFFGKHLFQEGPRLSIDAVHAAESCLSNGVQRLGGDA